MKNLTFFSKLAAIAIFAVVFFVSDAVSQTQMMVFKGTESTNSGIAMFNAGTIGMGGVKRREYRFGHLIPAPYNIALDNDTAYYYFGSKTVINNLTYEMPKNKTEFSPFTIKDSNLFITMFPNFNDSLEAYGYTWNDVQFDINIGTLENDQYGKNWFMDGSVETRYYTGLEIPNKTRSPYNSLNSVLRINGQVLGTLRFDNGIEFTADYKFPYTSSEDIYSFKTGFTYMIFGSSMMGKKDFYGSDAIFDGLKKDSKNKKFKINIPTITKTEDFSEFDNNYEEMPIIGSYYDAENIELIVNDVCDINFECYYNADTYSFPDGKTIDFSFNNDIMMNAKLICVFGDSDTTIYDSVNIDNHYSISHTYPFANATYQAKFTIINNYDTLCKQDISVNVAVKTPNKLDNLYINGLIYNKISCNKYEFSSEIYNYWDNNLNLITKWIISEGDTINGNNYSITPFGGYGLISKEFDSLTVGKNIIKLLIYDQFDSIYSFKEITTAYEVYDIPNVDSIKIEHISLVGGSRVGFEVINGSLDYQYNWNFGDNSNFSSKSNFMKHQYSYPGMFPINVSIKNDFNNYCEKFIFDTVYVNQIDSCKALASYIKINSDDQYKLCGNAYVNFELFSDYDNNKTYNYIFYYGDGTSDTISDPSNRYKDYYSNLNSQIGFTIQQTDSTSCFDTFNRELIVGGNANVDFNYSTVYKIGDTSFVQLIPILSEVSSNIKYRWNVYSENTSFYSNIEKPIIKMTSNWNNTMEISLEIEDSISGCYNNSTTKYIFIPANGLCNAAFTYELAEKTSKNYLVQFTNNSFSSAQTNNDSIRYLWNFGDGTTSNEKNPMHNFMQSGIYSVKLTMDDKLGCANTVTNQIQIDISEECIADFDYSNDSTSLEVSFTNYSLNTTRCMWVFGDGSTSTEMNPVHTFPAKGYYNVSLAIYNDNNNCMDYIEKQITIGSNFNDCQSNFLYMNELNSNEVFFSNLSIGNNLTNYLWSFGDGSISTSNNPIHTYTQSGYYDVCLTSSNNDNSCSNIFCSQIKVGNDTIICSPNFEYMSNYDSNSVSFINKTIGNPISTVWNFGDGQSSTDLQPTHNYASQGIYFASLTVKDINFKEYIMYKIIHLDSTLSGIYGDFGYKVDQTTKAAGKVDFKGTSFGDISKVIWNLGDGTLDSTSKNISHDYSQKGIFDVCFTVSDHTSGLSYTKCKNVEIIFENISQNENDLESIVYPNPASSEITISFVNNISQQIEFTMIDILGNKINTVYSGIFDSGIHKKNISVESYASGIYYLQIKTENGIQNKKIIITK